MRLATAFAAASHILEGAFVSTKSLVSMNFAHISLAKSASQVFKGKGCFVALVILNGALTKSVDAQSHNVDGAFLVEARINGTRAVLVVDTGAERSILDREFAQRIGLSPVEIVNIQRPDSAALSGVVLVADLDLQSAHGSGIKMMTDDLATSSDALGVHIDGFLGNDVLAEFMVTLDYAAGSVTFSPLSAIHHGAPIKLRRIGSRYFVHLSSDGVSLTFLLDTGTNFSALSNSGWSRLNHNKKALPTIDGVRSSGTSAPSKLVCIHQVSVGPASYKNLPMRIQPPTSTGIFADLDVSGLLGSDFLRRFVVSLNLANGFLYLRPDPNFKADQDRFSTIGIQFAKNPSGFFTVLAVWSPTPASEANVSVGDQIVAVNGLSTIEMTQEDLSHNLHGQPGRKIQLEISSHGNQRTVQLAIRNLLCQ